MRDTVGSRGPLRQDQWGERMKFDAHLLREIVNVSSYLGVTLPIYVQYEWQGLESMPRITGFVVTFYAIDEWSGEAEKKL